MGYAFISYSTKNQAKADAMRELFKKKGINTWMAPNDIPVGSKYAEVINKALKECSCLVLMLTDEAQNSVWVAKEVERAINYHKTIITVQLEDIVLNDEFEFYISTDHFIAIHKIDESTDEIKKVLASVIAYTGSGSPDKGGNSPEKDTSAEKKPLIKVGPKKKNKRMLWIVLAFFLLCAAVSFFLNWFNGNIDW
ncbi:MAG: TIR domain-containing protein [Clostridia bacterium]|nr:TIR domain-containing protein [Clostridia bacterium]